MAAAWEEYNERTSERDFLAASVMSSTDVAEAAVNGLGDAAMGVAHFIEACQLEPAGRVRTTPDGGSGSGPCRTRQEGQMHP
jgi:hypothetical protein